MYYVPGFSNYLNGLVPNEELLSEDMPAYDAPVYYTPPRPQPIAAEPYYEAPSHYAELSYNLPTAQPVAAEPYYEAPSYSLPTAQPVYSEPFLGGLSAPTLSEQPVSEAQPYSYTPAPGDPDWSTMTGWDWQSFLNQGKGGVNNADAVNKWIAEQAAQGREYIYDPNKDLAYSIAMNSAVPLMSNLGGPTYSNFDPNNPAASMAQIFRFDKEGTNSINAPLAYRSGENYILTDASGKNVLGRAASPEEMQQLVNLADAQKYGWNLYQGNEKGEYTPGAQLFGKGDPRLGGVMGALVSIGLPLAMSFIPGVGPLASAALTGAGATAGGLMTGKTVGDALKSGAISAATAGLLKGTGLDQTIGGALSDVPVVGDALRGVSNAFAPGASDAAAKAAADALANEIVVTGTKSALPGLVGGLAGSSLANTFTPSVVTNPVTGEMSLAKPTQPPAEQPPSGLEMADPNAIVVSGIPRAAANAVTGALGAVAPTLTQGPEPRRPDYGDKVEEEPGTTVVGQKPVDLPIVPPYNFNADFDATFGTPATQPAQPVEKRPEDEIVVTATKAPVNAATGVLASTIGNFAPSLNAPVTPAETAPAPKEKTTLEKVQDIADYMQLAGLGIGALGSLFGGGQQTAAKIANAGGLGGLNPTFSAKLPGANIPGLGGLTVGGGPRTAADLGQQGMTSPQDYYRYGYGPEQSFFGYVPQGAPNTSQAYTGYAKGGFAVEGPGDGREDKIPAMLSDGEYVIDAETVALLGNGSNKAGADMLDQFRVKVRKHKGRELARGKFSKNAKRPEQYLGGGRA